MACLSNLCNKKNAGKVLKISFDETKEDKGWDPAAYKVGKSRVKNRPAQNSIAGKLLAQQKAEELEKLAEEQQEQELKAKASQINYAPLQSGTFHPDNDSTDLPIEWAQGFLTAK